MPDQGSNDPTKPASPQKSKQSTRSDAARKRHIAKVNEKAQRVRDIDQLAFAPINELKDIPAVLVARMAVRTEQALLGPLLP